MDSFDYQELGPLIQLTVNLRMEIQSLSGGLLSNFPQAGGTTD